MTHKTIEEGAEEHGMTVEAAQLFSHYSLVDLALQYASENAASFKEWSKELTVYDNSDMSVEDTQSDLEASRGYFDHQMKHFMRSLGYEVRNSLPDLPDLEVSNDDDVIVVRVSGMVS